MYWDRANAIITTAAATTDATTAGDDKVFNVGPMAVERRRTSCVIDRCAATMSV